jgi:hypothetical protein
VSACEKCWQEANRQVLLLGGSVVDRYLKLVSSAQCPSEPRDLHFDVDDILADDE